MALASGFEVVSKELLHCEGLYPFAQPRLYRREFILLVLRKPL